MVYSVWGRTEPQGLGAPIYLVQPLRASLGNGVRGGLLQWNPEPGAVSAPLLTVILKNKVYVSHFISNVCIFFKS